MVVRSGATITLDSQISLLQELAIGSRLNIEVILEGLVPIKIPCLDIGEVQLGSW